MAYINGIQYALNAVVAANPGRRESGCDIEISYQNDAGSAQRVILRVTDSTVLRGADGSRVGCSDFLPGQRVNASFTGAMSPTTPPMARAYSITRLGVGAGTPGIDIDVN